MVSKGRLDSDFSQKTRDKLRDDVGNHCSLCDRPTSGPSREPGKRTNVGTAAHITAAAPGGPRYDATLSPAQRRSHENGIWCCRNCGKLVDDDASTFTVQELQDKKRKAIDLAHQRVTKGRVAPKLTIDVAALRAHWDAELKAMQDFKDHLRWVDKMVARVGFLATARDGALSRSGHHWSTYHHAATAWDGWDTPLWTTRKRQLEKVYGDRDWWSKTSLVYKRAAASKPSGVRSLRTVSMHKQRDRIGSAAGRSSSLSSSIRWGRLLQTAVMTPEGIETCQ